MQKERALNQAFAVRDASAIQELIAPEYAFHFIDGHVSGSLQGTSIAPRGKWVEDSFRNLSNGPLESSVVDARRVGNVGIVISHYRWSGSYHGAGFQYVGFVTDVWVRRAGSWYLLASHAQLSPPT